MKQRNNVLSLSEAEIAVESLRMKAKTYWKFLGVRYCFDNATLVARFMKLGEVRRIEILFDREAIELLNVHREPLICEFAREIVMAFDDPDIYPSWFIAECISELSEIKCEEIRGQREACELECQREELLYRQLQQLIPQCKEYLNYQKGLYDKCSNEYLLIKDELKHFKFNPISLFIKLNSARKYVKNAKQAIEKVGQYTKELAELEALFPGAERQYHLAILKNKPLIDSLGVAIQKEQARCLKRLEEANSVPPLTNEDCDGRIFVPVSFMYSMDPSILPGCYIVRNRYNGKCYVGHSKEPLARLRQVFNELKPRIPTLLNDYYVETESRRERMFEFCIIPVVDDERLTTLEKRLMDEYKTKTDGYNRKL